ncbi:hypothetical protein QBC40DRAFT_302497 [Triangularia verruculosa]|uniref:Uncharacterized protein n=1 Tax=Triangularia verruculosa TaxID=2587418 RepID=A0AAN7AMB4_9PEZI|nr:hypothetical protein QBC40DRAFT_302497 [Triangularia verruculosa]
MVQKGGCRIVVPSAALQLTVHIINASCDGSCTLSWFGGIPAQGSRVGEMEAVTSESQWLVLHCHAEPARRLALVDTSCNAKGEQTLSTVSKALSRASKALSTVSKALSRAGKALSKVSKALSMVSKALSTVSKALNTVSNG